MRSAIRRMTQARPRRRRRRRRRPRRPGGSAPARRAVRGHRPSRRRGARGACARNSRPPGGQATKSESTKSWSHGNQPSPPMSGFLDRLGRTIKRVLVLHRLRAPCLWVVVGDGRHRRVREGERRAHVRQLQDPRRPVPDRRRPARQPVPAANPGRAPPSSSRPRAGRSTIRPRRPRSPRPSTTSRSSPHVTQVVGPVGPLASTLDLEGRHDRPGDRAVRRAAADLPWAPSSRLEAAAAPATQAGMNVAVRRSARRLRERQPHGRRRFDRPADLDLHPRHRLRFDRGRGPPDRDRAVRSRDRDLGHHAARRRDRRRNGRTRPGHDDRPRRRHRLLVVHRHAPPREPARRDGRRSGDRARGRDGRPGGDLRRHHRRHRDLRPGALGDPLRRDPRATRRPSSSP